MHLVQMRVSARAQSMKGQSVSRCPAQPNTGCMSYSIVTTAQESKEVVCAKTQHLNIDDIDLLDMLLYAYIYAKV